MKALFLLMIIVLCTGCVAKHADDSIGGDEVLLCWGPPNAQHCAPATLTPRPLQQRT